MLLWFWGELTRLAPTCIPFIRMEGEMHFVIGCFESVIFFCATASRLCSTDKLPFVTMGSGSLAAMAVMEAEYKDNMNVRTTCTSRLYLRRNYFLFPFLTLFRIFWG